jgi:protein-S-isoprenylcysteine O-methyltransferase Ste14
MRKLLKALAFACVFYVLPLAGAPERIVTLPVVALFLSTVLVFLSQPELCVREARARSRDDGWSVLGIVIAGAVSQLVPVIEWGYFPGRPSAAAAITGSVLIAAGLAVRLLAIRALGPRFTATVHVESGQAVATRGVYAAVRHPSYAGALLAVLGSAVLLQSWIGAAFGTVAMAAAYAYRVRLEERALIASIGPAYQAYRSLTRFRLVPGIW